MRKKELQKRFERLALEIEDFADVVTDVAERNQISAQARLLEKEANRWRDLASEAYCLSKVAREVRE